MNTQNEYAYATETDDVENMNTPYSAQVTAICAAIDFVLAG